MTKKIRIENADNSNHKVRVYTEHLVEGAWVRSESPSPTDLTHPTDLTELWVHGQQRLVVEEADE